MEFTLSKEEKDRLPTVEEKSTLQELVLDLDGTINSLPINFCDSGPFQNAYCVMLPANSIFPQLITWWDSVNQLSKIMEVVITWNGAFFNKIVRKIYFNGVIQTTLTDSFDYTGGHIFNPNITRILS